MLIENRVYVLQNAAKTSLSYADVAKMPPQPPAAAPEKYVPSGLLREVTVETISDAAAQQPPPRIVEAINKARAGKPGKVIAARCHPSGDVLITADTPSTKALLEKESEWTKVIAGQARVKGRRFMVMAHCVQVSRVDPKEQAKSISNLEAQNPLLQPKVKILRVAWRLSTLRQRNTHGPLLIEVGSPEEANIFIEEGLVMMGSSMTVSSSLRTAL
jgi:hypothetical protein